MDDVFTTENESFMQETRLMENEYSVNLPTRFYYKKKWNTGWINVVNGYFSNPTHNPFLDETLYGSLSARLDQSATVHPSQLNTEESDNLVDELIEDMADGSFLSMGNDDWKEAAWQRKLRKQSKVKLRQRKH